MKESLVTSLETSKKLKELGFKMDSAMVWVRVFALNGKEESTWVLREKVRTSTRCETFPAYLAGELAEALPEECPKDHWLTITKYGKDEYFLEYEDPDINYRTGKVRDFTTPTLVEAMGLMLIHLLEQGLIK